MDADPVFVNGLGAMRLAEEWRAVERWVHDGRLPGELHVQAVAWMERNRDRQVVAVTPCLVCREGSAHRATWERVGTWLAPPQGVCESCA